MKRFEILTKEMLTPTICRMSVYAPLIAKAAQPGQFLMVRTDEKGERIPLTVSDYDREIGSVTIVTQQIGVSSGEIISREVGDCFADVVGPLGKPTHMDGLKKVCVVGGGTGNALAYPLATGMKKAGVEVDMIEGFKTKELVILEDEFRAGVDRLYVVTDDGSYGEKAFTTDKLKQLIAEGNEYDEIVAVGPPMMMKFVCQIAQEHNIKSIASLTAYMIDGTGMCGGCRCNIGGEDKFVCVDGPEFDGSLVDWDELIRRSNYYKDQEAEDRAHVCRLTGGVRYHD